MPQNEQNLVKFMMKTKVHWCSVFDSFFVFHPEAKHRKHKKSWDKNVLEMSYQIVEEKNINLALNVR